MAELMNTREVAQYLRLKQRKIYDLLQRGAIPCTRVGGKWLFPKDRIDQWLAAQDRGVPLPAIRPTPTPPAPVIAGSHDPFLEWCIGQSGCGLALLGGGSLAGLEQLVEGKAVACGLHTFDAATGTYNVPQIERQAGAEGLVAIEWAAREQGLVLAPGNPLGIRTIADLASGKARVVLRQPKAGSHMLFDHLLGRAGVSLDDLVVLPSPVLTETEVGLAVLGGQADAGLAIRAIARMLRLEFVPLHWERFDLVVSRYHYFEPPVQRLLTFARSPEALAKVADLQGYDLGGHGTVHYNTP